MERRVEGSAHEWSARWDWNPRGAASKSATKSWLGDVRIASGYAEGTGGYRVNWYQRTNQPCMASVAAVAKVPTDDQPPASMAR